MLRFLADESCDFSVVRALRTAGFDVVAVVESAPGATDERVIELGRSGGKILLTEDRDFGRLVFAATRATSGVSSSAFPRDAARSCPRRILDLIRREDDRLEKSFTVVGPNRIRITILPG